MQVRPASAASLFSQHADLLSNLHGSARLERLVDRLQMTIAVVPAAVVEQINHGHAPVRRACASPGSNASPASKPPSPAEAQTTSDKPLGCHRCRGRSDGPTLPGCRHLAAVDITGLVRHLRVAGEPALLCRVEERAGREQRRAGGPQPQSRVAIQAPDPFAIRIRPDSPWSPDNRYAPRLFAASGTSLPSIQLARRSPRP